MLHKHFAGVSAQFLADKALEMLYKNTMLAHNLAK